MAEERLKEEGSASESHEGYKPRVESCTLELQVPVGTWKMRQNWPFQYCHPLATSLLTSVKPDLLEQLPRIQISHFLHHLKCAISKLNFLPALKKFSVGSLLSIPPHNSDEHIWVYIYLFNNKYLLLNENNLVFKKYLNKIHYIILVFFCKHFKMLILCIKI